MNNQDMLTTDVVIIGGGVIGCAIAYFLQQSHVEVTLIEQGNLGGGASSAAAGLLAPLGPLSGPGPFADLLLTSFARFPTLVPELETLSGMHVGYEQTGALRIVRNPKRLARLQKRFERWQPLGLQMSWLSGAEVRQREPLLSKDTCGAVFAPEESQINAVQFVRALEQALYRLNVRVRSHTTVKSVQQTDGNVHAVWTSNDELIACKHVIIAAGTWSSQVATLFGTSLPVRPVRGQMLAFRQPASPLRHIIFGEALYLIPRGELVLVGATKEDVGFDNRVTPEGTAWLQNTALRLVPALEDSEIVLNWSGLRPGTSDSHPIIGLLPGWKNVLLATGHNSVGVILSPITGEAVTTYITAGHMPALLDSFSIRRFGD